MAIISKLSKSFFARQFPFHDLDLQGVIPAGGCFRTLYDKTEVADYDIFFKDLSEAPRVEKYYTDSGYSIAFRCPEGKLTTLKKDNLPKVQLITEHTYKTGEDLINTFDLTACMFALEDGFVLADFLGTKHAMKKEIHLNKVLYPAATMKRITKYIQKGYKLPSSTIELYISKIRNFTEEELNMRFYID